MLESASDTESRKNSERVYIDYKEEQSYIINIVNSSDLSHLSEKKSGLSVKVLKIYLPNPWKNGDKRGRLQQRYKDQEYLELVVIVMEKKIKDFIDKN